MASYPCSLDTSYYYLRSFSIRATFDICVILARDVTLCNEIRAREFTRKVIAEQRQVNCGMK